MRILIADDHALFREGLHRVLREFNPSVSVVEAQDIDAALTAATATDVPDLALIDLRMPGMNGVEGLRALTKAAPGMPLVVISALEGREYVLSAIEAGARGYVPKSLNSGVMISALQLVMSGGVYLPPALLDQGPSPDDALAGRSRRNGRTGQLTPRQKDVLRLLAQGNSNRDIAQALELSEGTVKLHVTALLKSLGVSNRTQAVLKAQEIGLLPRENGF